MSTIDALSGNLQHLDIAQKQEQEKAKEEGSNELGKTAFLELMIAQLNNQDPLKPQENGEFIAQLAQFSSVEGIDRLNDSFDSFAGSFTSNRALQASSLVGQQVTVPGDTSYLLEGGLMSAQATLPATTTDMAVNIYAENGELVQQFPVGNQAKGDINLRWDGLNLEVNGEILGGTGGRTEPLDPGRYQVEVTATQDGKQEQLATAVSANVNSVSVEPDGRIQLNLAGLGTVSLSDVKQFN